MRFAFHLVVGMAATLFSLWAHSGENNTYTDVKNVAALHEKQRINSNEPICKINLRNKLLHQQVAFSDSQNTMEKRRVAEESIDIARVAYDKSQSYCTASIALDEFLEAAEVYKSHVPKTGQIQQLSKGR